VGQVVSYCREFFIHTLAELRNLLPIAHLDGERYGAAAMRSAVFITPGEIVQVASGTFVSAADVHQIAKVNRRVGRTGGGTDDDVPNGSRIFELAGRIESYVFAIDLQLATGKSCIARRKRSAQIRGLHSVFGQLLLGIIQIDALRQYTAAVHLRDFRST